ncbi:MAG TPA: DUF4405 domain-containing protein [Natrialbaceae archaeon]|nr:DUF4405 domain-containing protein [Natrialbaceae archaeon]
MERFKRALLVNLVAFVVLIPVTISGFVLWLAVPGGQRGAGQQTYLGITRLSWIDVHLVTSILVVLIIASHLLLHWSYVKSVPRMVRRL